MKNLATMTALAVACCGLLANAPARADFYFRDDDRVVLRTVIPEPTERVTFYTPGTVLPETVTFDTLPVTVTERLLPPPAGASYISYGGNVYLIDSDRRIIDAVDLY